MYHSTLAVSILSEAMVPNFLPGTLVHNSFTWHTGYHFFYLAHWFPILYLAHWLSIFLPGTLIKIKNAVGPLEN